MLFFLITNKSILEKMTRKTDQEIILEKVFYLKADTNLTSEEQNVKLSLIKLGNEIYKPRDQMIINRSHVLFLEEMQSKSEVMQAIERYEKQTR